MLDQPLILLTALRIAARRLGPLRTASPSRLRLDVSPTWLELPEEHGHRWHLAEHELRSQVVLVVVDEHAVVLEVAVVGVAEGWHHVEGGHRRTAGEGRQLALVERPDLARASARLGVQSGIDRLRAMQMFGSSARFGLSRITPTRSPADPADRRVGSPAPRSRGAAAWPGQGPTVVRVRPT